jgi:hypothetical protein
VYILGVRLLASFSFPLIALTAITACGAPHEPSPSPSHGSPRVADAAVDDASGPAQGTARAATPAGPTASFDGRSIEIACNGQDDDGDGLVDVLLPVGPNACETGKLGACGSGFASCDGDTRTCMAPSPMPEVKDGIDNDCNGVVDDVPEASVHPRAVLLAPRYVWSDASPDVANVTTALAQAGISFDRPANGSDWASVDKLDEYALAIVPGYLLGSVVGRVREKLEAFVTRGGVLVVFKPIGENDHLEALTLAGLRAGTRHRDIEELRFDGPSSPGTIFVDSTEERSLRINPKGEKAGLEVWTFEADPDAKTEVLGAAFRGGTSVGAAVTRRRLGKGAVYAVGHDLASFGSTRCYINCFESAGDVMRLLFDGALREGSQGHIAVLATAPALASSVLVLTHDVNTHEALLSGNWGEPGAIQFAKVEKERGVHATFHVMTDYRDKHFSAQTVRDLCALDMCPAGIQGVARVPQFARLPAGMVRDSETSPWRCQATLATYNVPSLCGEISLSAQLIQSAGSRAPQSWRSPYLGYHAELIRMLASGGILFDSSFGIGDLPYNLPLDMATTGIQQRRFHRRPVLEFPLTVDDGIDLVRDGGARERIELQPSTEARFRSLWEYVLLQNRMNRSMTTLRINPVRGEGMRPENLHAKAVFLGRFLDDLARSRPDVLVRSVQELGDFWRAREGAKLEARFDKATGYAGTLTIGKTTSAGITIELGDAIKSFECAKCGETKVAGKRVAIMSALPPGTKAEFTAKVQ